MAIKRRKFKSRRKTAVKTGKMQKLLKMAKRAEKLAIKKIGTLTRKIKLITKQNAAKIKKLRKAHAVELKRVRKLVSKGTTTTRRRKTKSTRKSAPFMRKSARRTFGKKTYGFKRTRARKKVRWAA